MLTPYDVLGVSETASDQEIRRAYRKLARAVHPDLNAAPDAASRFLDVKEAYEALSDPFRKSQVDGEIARRRASEAAARPTGSQQPAERAKPNRSAAERERVPPDHVTGADSLRLTMLLNRGRYVDAEKLARRMVAADPTASLAYAVIADVAQMRGDVATAAKYYAFAAQYDPRNPVYQRRHEEMLAGVSDQVKVGSGSRSDEPRMAPIGVGVFVLVACACYVALAKREPPILPGIPWVSEWSLSVVVAIFMSGLAVGAALRNSGLLARFRASRGSAVSRVPLSLVIGVLSILNFWLASAVYIAMGMTQHAFNPSVSRLLGGLAATVGVIALAAWATSDAKALQTLAWGGNLAYAAGLFGWIVADAADPPQVRAQR